jgi:hypothetical protein
MELAMETSQRQYGVRDESPEEKDVNCDPVGRLKTDMNLKARAHDHVTLRDSSLRPRPLHVPLTLAIILLLYDANQR